MKAQSIREVLQRHSGEHLVFEAARELDSLEEQLEALREASKRVIDFFDDETGQRPFDDCLVKLRDVLAASAAGSEVATRLGGASPPAAEPDIPVRHRPQDDLTDEDRARIGRCLGEMVAETLPTSNPAKEPRDA